MTFAAHPPCARAAAAAAVMVVAALASGCDDGLSSQAARPASAETTWREIGAWSGRLSQQTESFEVSTVPLRLHWQITGERSPGAGRLTVTLHSAASGRPLQTIVEGHGVGSAMADVADEQRWAYLVIEAANADWQMTLEQPVAAGAR